jgi:hypothetical protein
MNMAFGRNQHDAGEVEGFDLRLRREETCFLRQRIKLQRFLPEPASTTTTNRFQWCYQHTGIVRIQQQQVHSPAILRSVHPQAACSGNPCRNRLHQTGAWSTPPPGSGFAAITRHGHWQRSDGQIRGDQRVERGDPRPSADSTGSITPDNGKTNCSY